MKSSATKWNKALAVLTCLVMSFTMMVLLPPPQITSHAADVAFYANYIRSLVGTPAKEWGDVEGTQCVELPKFYIEDVYGISTRSLRLGNGNEMYLLVPKTFPNLFESIAYYDGFVPQPGDIISYHSSTAPNYGHAALVYEVSGNSYKIAEQWKNSGTVRGYTKTIKAGQYGVDYSIIGVARPKIDDPKPEIIPSKPILNVSSATASDKVTFSWNACSNTDRYDLRVYAEGMSGDNYFIYKQTNGTSLTYTLPEGNWWANVVAVNNTANDHETYGWSEENHFSVNFGYPEPKAMTTYNGHIYALYEATTYYDQAQNICKKMGGHLATITSAEENKAVSSLMENAADIGYWMGASDAKSEGTWVWETGEKFSYTNWDKNEPNNDSEVEHYLMMYPSGLWNDARSFGIYHYGFILEIDPLKATKEEEYNGHIYTRYDSTLNWLEAEDYCKLNGGHLVTINDKAENDFVKSLIADGKQSSYWIGLYDAKKNVDSHDYVWASGESTTFTSWNKDDGANQPDCWMGVEFYGEMYKSNGNWNDMSSYGFGERGFVCEIKKNIKSIELTNLPYKTEYNPGDKLDLRGLSLKVTYDKGNDAIITEGFEANADLSTVGKKTVTITYGDKKFNFDVNVAYAKLNARLTSKSEKRLALTWTPEASATRYEVLLNGEVADDECLENKCTLVNLTPNTNYQIQVIAYNGTTKLTESDILYITTSNKEMGDVNQDGSVEVTDIVNLQKYILNFGSVSAPSLDAADMNYDGVIDVFDLGLLKRVMLGDWTEWTTEAPPEDAKEVETKTEYRYAEKTYQESSEELPSPWVLDNKETVYSDFGAWSDWQEGEVTASDTREVETKTDPRSEITGYHMFYYVTQWESSPYTRCYRNFSVGDDFEKYHARRSYDEHSSMKWGIDKIVSVAELNSATVIEPEGNFSGNYAGVNKSDVNGYYFSNDPDYLWYQGDAVVNNYDVTMYRYHDRATSTKYTYYKTSEFSQWSETPIEEKDGIVVETRTVYRYHR